MREIHGDLKGQRWDFFVTVGQEVKDEGGGYEAFDKGEKWKNQQVGEGVEL